MYGAEFEALVYKRYASVTSDANEQVCEQITYSMSLVHLKVTGMVERLDGLEGIKMFSAQVIMKLSFSLSTHSLGLAGNQNWKGTGTVLFSIFVLITSHIAVNKWTALKCTSMWFGHG